MKTLTKVNRRFKISLFFFVTLILFFNQKLNAQEFIIGVEDVSYYPLFEFQTKRDTYSKELLNRFASSRGYKFTYLPLPIKRFDKWLMEEKIDFKYPDNSRWYPDPTLKSKYTFSQSTIKLVAGTTVLKSFLKQNKSEFKSLGTLLGFYPTTWIEQIKSGRVKLYEDVSTKILVRQLLENNVDGIDIEPSVISYYLRELGEPTDIVTIDKRYRYDVYDFHFSTIKYPKVIKEFNDFLNSNKTLLIELNRKYNITDYKPYLQ